jgi:hypothetical protein
MDMTWGQSAEQVNDEENEQFMRSYGYKRLIMHSWTIVHAQACREASIYVALRPWGRTRGD